MRLLAAVPGTEEMPELHLSNAWLGSITSSVLGCRQQQLDGQPAP